MCRVPQVKFSRFAIKHDLNTTFHKETTNLHKVISGITFWKSCKKRKKKIYSLFSHVRNTTCCILLLWSLFRLIMILPTKPLQKSLCPQHLGSKCVTRICCCICCILKPVIAFGIISKQLYCPFHPSLGAPNFSASSVQRFFLSI